MSITGGEPIEIPLQFTSGERIEIAVSGTTRYITTPGNYQYRFIPGH